MQREALHLSLLTLGIFNQKTRNKKEAWRIIGFIPNLDGVSKKKLTLTEKHSDYHSLLNVVFAPLVKLQSYNGIACKMVYNDVLYEVNKSSHFVYMW
jgi:hypothetical protein